MIRYLIVDDEYIAHEIIIGYCKLLPKMVLMKQCYDALEALDYLSTNEIDLIFLDLNMPQLKGFEFLRTLHTPPKIIVTTAYKEYALEGYELNVTDYLLKPFSFERFLKAIHKTFDTSSNSSKTPKRIFLKSNKKYIHVTIDEIEYIEAAGNYTKVVCISETIIVREKISNLLAILPKQDFLQIHKSFIIAIAHIKNIEGNRVFMEKNALPIGKMYRNNVFSLLK